MVSFQKAVVLGFLIWLIAFASAFLLFPLRADARPLFESIMPVVLTLATVFFAERYFRRVQGRFAREGLLIGMTYLLIPVVTTGMGLVRAHAP